MLSSPFSPTSPLSSPPEDHVPTSSIFTSPYIRKMPFYRRLFCYLRRKISEKFLLAIPSNEIRDMPPKYVFYFGFCVFIILAAVFATLFSISYDTSLGTEYLSPLDSGSTTASPYCDTIAVSNTGEYRATQSGIWEGSPGFQYSQASYIASVTNWQISSEEYESTLNLLYDYLAEAGNTTKNTDLGNNLIYWFSFTALPTYDNNVQRFNLVGDPLIVFNRQYLSGAIGTVTGDCNITSTTGFYAAKGILYTDFPYNSFMGNPVCNQTIKGISQVLGYKKGINSNLQTIKFDVRSLVTALAINLKISYLTALVEIPAFRTNYTYNHIDYNVSRYYDPHFPGMTPVQCIANPNHEQCVLVIGESTFAIPFFHHLGNNTEFPERCNCSYLSEDDLTNPFANCNMFRFLAGYIFYPTNTPDGIFELMTKYNFSFNEVNNFVYPISYMASYWGQQSSYRDNYFDNITYREELYQFCNISIGYCSISTFSLFDGDPDWSISSYYYQLQTGACQDMLSTSRTYW
jgi:hypothetical protein